MFGSTTKQPISASPYALYKKSIAFFKSGTNRYTSADVLQLNQL